jgi:hypothetical protein
MNNKRDKLRLQREIHACFGDWDANLANHPEIKPWHRELCHRVWRQIAICWHTGSVGNDWERLVEDIRDFQYVNQALAAKDRGGDPKQKEIAAP